MQAEVPAKREKAREILAAAEIVDPLALFMQVPEDVGRDTGQSGCLRRGKNPRPLGFRDAGIMNLSRYQQLPPPSNEQRAFVKRNGNAPVARLRAHGVFRTIT